MPLQSNAELRLLNGLLLLLLLLLPILQPPPPRPMKLVWSSWARFQLDGMVAQIFTILLPCISPMFQFSSHRTVQCPIRITSTITHPLSRSSILTLPTISRLLHFRYFVWLRCYIYFPPPASQLRIPHSTHEPLHEYPDKIGWRSPLKLHNLLRGETNCKLRLKRKIISVQIFVCFCFWTDRDLCVPFSSLFAIYGSMFYVTLLSNGLVIP